MIYQLDFFARDARINFRASVAFSSKIIVIIGKLKQCKVLIKKILTGKSPLICWENYDFLAQRTACQRKFEATRSLSPVINYER